MIVFEEPANILLSNAQTLTVPVNTVGAMGAGLALAFKKYFPGLYQAYRKACAQGVFEREGLFTFSINDRRKVLCFPTKHHWQQDSDIELIERGLKILAGGYCAKHGITKLALPTLGCGLGKLKWEAVRPLIYKHLDPLDLEVGIFLRENQ